MQCIRRYRNTALASLFFLGLFTTLWAQGSPSEPGTLHFIFAAGARIAKQGDSRPVPVETQNVLNSGDRIKFFWEPKSAAYFYLFHVGPNGDLAQLFPQDLAKAQVSAGEQVYVPEGPLWFELDAASGTEKFILLASKSRLGQLESLYARHVTFRERADTQSSTKAILDEIARLNSQRKSLAAPAEKPVRIAGKFRAPSKTDPAALPDILPFAKEIVTSGTYSKTITIDHR